jgi:hypothetical protein
VKARQEAGGRRQEQNNYGIKTGFSIRYGLTLSGKDGADADKYQEKDINNALKDLENLQQE